MRLPIGQLGSALLVMDVGDKVISFVVAVEFELCGARGKGVSSFGPSANSATTPGAALAGTPWRTNSGKHE